MSELMILPQVSSQFYMMFAGGLNWQPFKFCVLGAAPRVVGCEGSQMFDESLDDKEMCQEYISLGSNCSEPQLDYQFHSINVEVTSSYILKGVFFPFQWGYVCQAAKIVKNSISVQMFGVLVGSVVFGQLSDTFGRKNVR